MENRKIIKDLELAIAINNGEVSTYDIKAMIKILNNIGYNIEDSLKGNSFKTLKEFQDETESIFEYQFIVGSIDDNIKLAVENIDKKMLVLQKFIILSNEFTSQNMFSSIRSNQIRKYFSDHEQVVLKLLKENRLIGYDNDYYFMNTSGYETLYNYILELKVSSINQFQNNSINSSNKKYHQIMDLLNNYVYTDEEFTYLLNVLNSLKVGENLGREKKL